MCLICVAVEELLLRMAKTGQISHKISEPELIELLEKISGEVSKRNETKIVVSALLIPSLLF